MSPLFFKRSFYLQPLLLGAFILLPTISAQAQHTQFTLKTLEDNLKQVQEKRGIAGVAVAIVSKDSLVWSKGFGMADKEQKLPATDATLFRVASVAKSFIGAAALVARERGMLKLEDPIEKLVPEIKIENPWRATTPVRLIHLLEHTAGFDDPHFELAAVEDASVSLAQIMRLAQPSFQVRWEPGSFTIYNNLAPSLAAHAIAVAAKQPFDVFVREALLDPLEMGNTSYDRVPVMAAGYDGAGQPVPYVSIPHWPSGALNTSAQALGNFVQMLLSRGRYKGKQILEPASVALMETPQTGLEVAAGLSFGTSAGLLQAVYQGHVFWGSEGGMPGATALFGYSQKLGRGFVLLINQSDVNKAKKELLRHLTSFIVQQAQPAMPEVAVQGPLALKQWEGIYQRAASTQQLSHFLLRLGDFQRVWVQNDTLRAGFLLGGEGQAMLGEGHGQFRFIYEPVATSIFVQRDEAQYWIPASEQAVYRKIPAWKAWGQLLLTILSLLLFVSVILVAVFWLPASLVSKLVGRSWFTHAASAQSLLLLSVVLLLIAFAVLWFTSAGELAVVSWQAVLYVALTYAFVAVAVLAMIKSTYAIYQGKRGWWRWHALLASCACVIIAVYLIQWQIIGLIPWEY